MGGCNVAARFHLFSRFIQAHALTGRYRLSYYAEAVYVRCVRGIRAYGIEFHLIRYRVIYLVVAFSHGLLVLQRAVGVVVCGCRVGARIHPVARIVQSARIAHGCRFPYRAEAVNYRGICCVGSYGKEAVALGVIIIPDKFASQSFSVVRFHEYLVVAFAYRLLVLKSTVFVVMSGRDVASGIHLLARFVQANTAAVRHRLSYSAEAVDNRSVCGVFAYSIKLYLVGYRVIDLVVTFTYGLLVLESTVFVVMSSRDVASGIHLLARFIQTHALAIRHGLPYRSEFVYNCCIRGVFADRVKLHLFGQRVVDLVVALADCLLVL